MRLVRVARMSRFCRVTSKFKLRRVKVEGHALLRVYSTLILDSCFIGTTKG